MSSGMSSGAADVLATLAERGWTLAVAESLTGGLLAAEFVAVPGASTVFVGGVVSYATRTKAQVLGVDADELARTGPVAESVAAQMAEGAARVLGADVAAATTGVAGPGPADGVPAGTVVVAVLVPGRAPVCRWLQLAGERDRVRRDTVAAALALLAEVLGPTAPEPGSSGRA